MIENFSTKKILFAGNPNAGKSSIINALCNKHLKTGNYAGVTVFALTTSYQYQKTIVEITDLPGAYSIYPSSKDEKVLIDYILNNDFDGVVYVLDALQLRRGLLMFHQIQDLGLPILLIINQIDEANKRGIDIDFAGLSTQLGVKIIPTNAIKKKGINELKEAIHHLDFQISITKQFELPMEFTNLFKENNILEMNYHFWLKTIQNDQDVLHLPKEIAQKIHPKRLQTQETIRRHQRIDEYLSKFVHQENLNTQLFSEKLDRLLVHPILGYFIFIFVLLIVFQAVFLLADIPMNWIDFCFSLVSDVAKKHLPNGAFTSLLSDGIVPGLGGIIIFAPQIGILLYILHLLEDSGYMARVVFLMDRFLKPFGLSGKSMIPLVSGVACAIPAIMATRNIENTKERLITILVTPFITCSARLPVYTIIISLILPNKKYFGLDYRAIALLGMYVLGILMALFAAFILKNLIKKEAKSFLIMDLPPYKLPQFVTNLKIIFIKIWDFIWGAGKIIFSVSIILWALSYIGPKKTQNEWFSTDVALQDSYLSKIGHFIEPAVSPLGYDWKMGISLISSFAAREVFVGTMSTLYSLDENVEDSTIILKMKNDIKQNGSPVFSFATGLSVLVFYAFAMQCISTIAVVYRETKSMKWTLLQLVGMSVLAYLSSFFIYQIFR